MVEALIWHQRTVDSLHRLNYMLITSVVTLTVALNIISGLIFYHMFSEVASFFVVVFFVHLFCSQIVKKEKE